MANDGFTMLEIVVAVAILATLTFATLQVVVPVSRQGRISRELQVVTAEAKKVLEKVQAAPFKDITRLYPDKTSQSVSCLQGGLVTVDYTGTSADPLYLQVNLSWISPDLGPMTRSFVTVRTE